MVCICVTSNPGPGSWNHFFTSIGALLTSPTASTKTSPASFSGCLPAYTESTAPDRLCPTSQNFSRCSRFTTSSRSSASRSSVYFSARSDSPWPRWS